MALVSAGQRESLESRTGTAFLISGALLLFTAVVYVVQMATQMSLEGGLTGLPLVASILLSYVAMIGLYSRLVDRTRGLALVGLLLLVLPFLANLLIIFVYAPATGTVPPAVEVLVAVLWGTIGIGSAVLAVGTLRTGAFTPVLGLALFGWSVPWFTIGVAGFVYGAQHPAWIDLGISVVGGASLLTVGSQFREESPHRDRTEPAGRAA